MILPFAGLIATAAFVFLPMGDMPQLPPQAKPPAHAQPAAECIDGWYRANPNEDAPAYCIPDWTATFHGYPERPPINPPWDGYDTTNEAESKGNLFPPTKEEA